MSRVNVVVHAGFLKDSQFANHRDETIYGNYQSYLKSLEEFVNRNECIMLTNPEAYRPNCRRIHDLIPFKIPRKTKIIVDYEQPRDDWEEATTNYVGIYQLLKILEKKVSKEEEMRLCGERLWWINSDKSVLEPGKKIEVKPGCVIYYLNQLTKEGYKPKIERQLCYPTKDPPDGKDFAKMSFKLV